MNNLAQIAHNVNNSDNPFDKAFLYVYDVLGKDQLLALACETGFIVRCRDLCPGLLVASFLVCANNAKTISIDSLHTCYNTAACRAGVPDISKQAFEKQVYKPAFLSFCRAVFHKATNSSPGLELSAAGALARIIIHILGVISIRIADGTTIGMNDQAFRYLWQVQSCRAQTGAGLKVHCNYNPVASVLCSITVDAAVSSEIAAVPVEDLQHCLWLADAGYISARLFKQLSDNGSYFLVRARENVNPLVSAVHIYDPDMKLKGVITADRPLKLSDFTARHNLIGNDIFDFDIILPGGVNARLIKYFAPAKAKRRPEENDFAYFYCNVSRSLLDAEDIKSVYHLRWSVENLCIKSLKQFNCLMKTRIMKRDTAEAFIFLAALAHTVKAVLGGFMQQAEGKTLSSIKIEQRAGILLNELLDTIYYLPNLLSLISQVVGDTAVSHCLTSVINLLKKQFQVIARLSVYSRLSKTNKELGKSFLVHKEKIQERHKDGSIELNAV